MYFPRLSRIFLLSILTSIFTYAIILPCALTGHDTVASIITWVFVSAMAVIIVLIIRSIFIESSKTPNEEYAIIYTFMDIMFTVYHLWALIAFSIWLMDTSAGKDVFFTGVNMGASKYSIFVGDFLLLSIAVANSAGFVHVQPASAKPIVGLLGIFVSLTGVFMYSFILSIMMQLVKFPRPITARYVTGSRIRPKLYNGLK